VGHEYHGFCTLFERHVNGGQGSDDALGVGNRTVVLLGHIEIDAHQDTFVRAVDIFDRLLGELHG